MVLKVVGLNEKIGKRSFFGHRKNLSFKKSDYNSIASKWGLDSRKSFCGVNPTTIPVSVLKAVPTTPMPRITSDATLVSILSVGKKKQVITPMVSRNIWLTSVIINNRINSSKQFPTSNLIGSDPYHQLTYNGTIHYKYDTIQYPKAVNHCPSGMIPYNGNTRQY